MEEGEKTCSKDQQVNYLVISGIFIYTRVCAAIDFTVIYYD